MHTIPACAVSRPGLVEYRAAWDEQRRLVEVCREDGEARLLLLEHPPTYTFGVRGRSEHLLLTEDALERLGAAVHRVDRGGDVTFHGPGQLIGYPVLNLRRWGQGPVWYVCSLEAALIQTLEAFGIEGRREPGKPGVWAGGAKIASIGVRVSRGVTSHGLALNVDTDMSWFSHMVPCGIPDVRMTSMALSPGGAPSMDDVMNAFVEAFGRVFQIEMHEDASAAAPPALEAAAAL